MDELKDGRYGEIYSFWKNRAASPVDGDGLKPTARDLHLQEVVEAAIGKWLRSDMRLLDIGCGDGSSVSRFAANVQRAVGIDYIDQHIESAKTRGHGTDNVSFEVGSVLDLTGLVERHGLFGAITTIRCLINLADWPMQREAIKQIAACLEPGGLYLVSEGWQDGIDGLNVRRQRAGLERIEVAKYNTMINRREFEKEVSEYFEVVAYENLGFYLFMSRVWQPVFVAPMQPVHDHPINRTAARLTVAQTAPDAFLDCDYAGVYVLRRR
jgi:2-polyprenyl-3-methyl-5-hydroxy-6-metoxy-1,4-benzoquinol methylase